MEENADIEFTKSGKYKVQKVKNYDANDINRNINRNNRNTKSAKNDAKITQNIEKKSQNQNIGKTKRIGSNSDEQTFWQKVVCYVTYFFGLTSVLYFLGSAWLFLGLVSVAVSLLVVLLCKTQSVKEESGKVFFVTLCGTIISVLFWVLHLVTRRYGIGFLSTMFRALQMAGAFLSAILVGYYFIEYVTKGKVRIKWLSNITEKTQEKFSHSKTN